MSDLKLFHTRGGVLCELESSSAPLEKALQTRFETNLETLLGVRFLASEYVTSHGGRMDTLGIDENGYPVIIEYWLMDHRGDFELLVRDRYGKEVADQIEWSAPRLICIAADFTKYDEHAVKQMGRNIELIRYRKFGEDLLLLELLTAVSAASGAKAPNAPSKALSGAGNGYKTVTEYLADAAPALANLHADVETYLLGLADDVTKKVTRFYLAYRRIKNFACVEVRPTLGQLKVFLKIDPDSVELHEGFSRDVRKIGHFGTGDLELTLGSYDDFERAKPLILRSYEES
ncbi:DUF5655 domain-containing protein [Novosphingobium huizhouense]|uniref:DUF5655 domain-containing protein n=1 Tax=Novosphingobium huizhouense TaxID=2866625 RepID=UPI001CD89CB0|nr:DUF5655 domain-containing protein [Novosphingobium huizhouense]